jgi:porin
LIATDAMPKTNLRVLFAMLTLSNFTAPAFADDSMPNPSPVASQTPAPSPGLFDSARTNLLGDLGGFRAKLADKGITFGFQEIDEVFGNVSGGVRRGAEYDGLTTMTLGIDTGKAFGWDGGTFQISALQIHGRSLSADNLDNFQTASGIEAQRATRLWELWYQQTFFGGKADAKVGQQSLDQEFMVSQYSALFINTVMGWPMLPTADLYAGGPAYPLSSLGFRLRAHPSDNVTVLAGIFDDNPPGGPFSNDPQLRDGEASGTRFNLGTGALFIAELQYAINQPPADDKAPRHEGLPGTYKLGVWFDTGAFPDQRFATNGVSLANPTSSGVPQPHRDNFSVYALADQMVWRPDPNGPQSVGAFARVMGAPSDRNLIDFSLDAGISLKAPLPGRDQDTFGIGYGLAKISGVAAGLDHDTAFFTGTPFPVRSTEQFIEVTYQIQVAPW